MTPQAFSEGLRYDYVVQALPVLAVSLALASGGSHDSKIDGIVQALIETRELGLVEPVAVVPAAPRRYFSRGEWAPDIEAYARELGVPAASLRVLVTSTAQVTALDVAPFAFLTEEEFNQPFEERFSPLDSGDVMLEGAFQATRALRSDHNLNSVLELSRPQVSKDGRNALVYCVSFRAPLHSSGYLVVLERDTTTSAWRVRSLLNVWVS